MSRADLKLAIVARLDAVCEEHPMGHQESKARRYIFRGENGTTVEMMFEQNETVPANLWVPEAPLASKLETIAHQRSPASSLYTKVGKNGKMLYGRHSSMERMPMIGKADLVRIRLESTDQLDRILDALDAA